METIELRSQDGINRALQTIQDGDYNTNWEGELCICFDNPFFSDDLDDNVKVALCQFMRKAGSLPALTKLKVTASFSIGVVKVPVGAVTSALSNARGLEQLTISYVVLVGTNAEFEELGASLQDHPALKIANFRCSCRRVFEEGDDGPGIDPDKTCLSPMEPVLRASQL